MTNEIDNKIITTIYEKKLSDKPLSIDKIQPELGNYGDHIQEDLNHIAKLTKNIMEDIEEDTVEDIIKVDFKKIKKS